MLKLNSGFSSGCLVPNRRGGAGPGAAEHVQQVGGPVGGAVAQVHRGRRPYRRREEDEEDDVGPILVVAPALLQVSLYRQQGETINDT